MATNIIAIAGPSGSGKSSLAKALQQEIRSAIPSISIDILPEDSYYHDQAHRSLGDREQVNYDHPDALDHQLLAEHLAALRAGRAIEAPVYDYAQHTRSGHTRRIEPAELLIVEGILLLSVAELRPGFDLRLFVDTPLELCLSRRLQRDCEERGRSAEFVRLQFETTVRPMFHAHIEPVRDHAHLVLCGRELPTVMARQALEELRNRGLLPDS